MIMPLQFQVGESAPSVELCPPEPGQGLVIFADGAGHGENRRRHHDAARRLQMHGLGTLLFGAAEVAAATAAANDDVAGLARRLRWALGALPASLQQVPIGLLGCGDGAAAVLLVAAQQPDRVRAVVCCGGHFDAAEPMLADVRVPTMLMAGAADLPGVDGTRRAHALLRCEKRIDIVPRATRRFLEAGTLELAVERAAEWFGAHLS
jgi:putative phosphoribosyl transferase